MEPTTASTGTFMAALKIMFIGFFLKLGETLAAYVIRVIVFVTVIVVKIVGGFFLIDFLLGFK